LLAPRLSLAGGLQLPHFTFILLHLFFKSSSELSHTLAFGGMESRTITSVAELCRDEFTALLGSDPLRHQADLAEAVEEEQARFRVWAAHIGTFATHHSSLDYRLRESEKVRSLVISQLEILRRAEARLLKLLQPSKSHSFNMTDSSDSWKIHKMLDHCTRTNFLTPLRQLLTVQKHQFQTRNPRTVMMLQLKTNVSPAYEVPSIGYIALPRQSDIRA
jgi:hypothetical protein